MFTRKTLSIVTLTVLVFALTALGSAADGGTATYRVTIKNVAQGQPVSPPVAATHRPNVTMFKTGSSASAELEAIAEDGNQGPMAALLGTLSDVTDVVDVGMPLTPSGSHAAGFSDIVTFEIEAAPGDRLSIVGMLICSNDGFAGLNRQPLPQNGVRVFEMDAYDAGTEANTELSADLVDPCSGIGPVGLNGDPNGNNNAGIETPNAKVSRHPGVKGDIGDLIYAHDFDQPVAIVIVERIN